MDQSQWQSQGQFIHINGHRHFYLDTGGTLPCLLVLHGYPTCSFDYHKALPLLSRHYRVVIHDHLGFGLSDKPLNYSYSLMEQTDQAIQLWQALNITEATILAHDYGTSIATEILARHNRNLYVGFALQHVVLCNGSMHIELSQLRLIQKLLLNKLIGPWVAKRTSQTVFNRNMRKLYFAPGKVDAAELDTLWQLMVHNEGRCVLHQITGYIRERHQYWHRWIGALQKTPLPVRIIWAMNDPVAVAAMAGVLHKEIMNSELIELDGLGHFPMLEDAERWVDAVLT
ncbi:alpha/beta fold hydrolase [Marinicella sediminis]|uniref:Alpha/beta fold hydrolase n=1 Tax=Marinicella sediminis TaxID=1792834 RepID=A0ABV7J786_9GAMM|nr:alpha/beta hydrolase [Marinicella sediminis]